MVQEVTTEGTSVQSLSSSPLTTEAKTKVERGDNLPQVLQGCPHSSILKSTPLPSDSYHPNTPPTPNASWQPWHLGV